MNKIIKHIDWIATVFSIIGIVLNSFKNIYCWPVWIISNFIWIYYSYNNKQNASLFLWIVFLIFNIFGWYQWTQN